MLPVLLATAGAASAASWLDAPPAGWNVPGAAVPRAPMDGELPPRCRTGERRASTVEERQLVAGGWLLQRAWEAQRDGDMTSVEALAGYDGMCRPVQVNVFVFAGGQFAGTISPVLMDAREDGQLSGDGPLLLGDGMVTAAFDRYRAHDPLCCPSGGQTRVVYQLQRVKGLPVLAPMRIGDLERAPASARPGALAPAELALMGLALAVAALCGGGVLAAGRRLLRRI